MKRKFFALFCVLLLTLTACSPAEPAPSVPDEPAAPETMNVTVYVPDEQAEYLSAETVAVPAADDVPALLLAGLKTAGVLPETVALRSCEVSDGEIALDLNDAFLTALDGSGSAGETMLLYAVADTFLAGFEEAEKLVLTANGETIETEHELYDAPFTELKYVKE